MPAGRPLVVVRPGATGVAGPSWTRLLAETLRVSTASCDAVGTAIRDRVPRMSGGQYVPASVAPTPMPFMFATKSVFPSPARATALGYHAVGIRPATVSPLVAPSGASVTTATSSLPASATYRVLPSRLT